MAIIPSGTRFIGIATSVDLTERKSAVLNKTTEPFTIEDIASTVGVGATGTQTFGSLEIENVSPYQILSYNLNSITTTGASDKVVLPSSAEVGKIVYVFAMNNANSFSVRGNQSGTAVISAGGIASQSSSISVATNTSYLFISLGGGYWKASIL
jgi:hypothetical protein